MKKKKKIIENRKKITEYESEIKKKKNQQKDVWKKLRDEVHSNQARYRKMDGLSGFIDTVDGKIIAADDGLHVQFESNSVPSASALSQIEVETGLKFKRIIGDNVYEFNL